MTHVACYTDFEDCVADGSHLTDCDDDGYCNHCGTQEGPDDYDDSAVQRTFGMFEGMKEVMPVAAHPYDYVDLEDTGGFARRMDCHESADGKFWLDWEARDDHEETLVENLLDSIIEGDDDWLGHDDCMSQYAHCLSFDTDHQRDCVKEWLGDNCEGYDEPDKDTVQSILDALIELADCKATTRNYSHGSGHDYVIGSVEMGEHEVQVDVSCYPVFAALAARNILEDRLQSSNFLGTNESRVYDADGVLVRVERIPYVSGGSFTMMNSSDIHHWWGCTSQQMWDVCSEKIDGLEYIGYDDLEFEEV